MSLKIVAGIHQVEAGMLLSYKKLCTFYKFSWEILCKQEFINSGNKPSVSNKSGFYIKM